MKNKTLAVLVEGLNDIYTSIDYDLTFMTKEFLLEHKAARLMLHIFLERLSYSWRTLCTKPFTKEKIIKSTTELFPFLIIGEKEMAKIEELKSDTEYPSNLTIEWKQDFLFNAEINYDNLSWLDVTLQVSTGCDFVVEYFKDSFPVYVGVYKGAVYCKEEKCYYKFDLPYIDSDDDGLRKELQVYKTYEKAKCEKILAKLELVYENRFFIICKQKPIQQLSSYSEEQYRNFTNCQVGDIKFIDKSLSLSKKEILKRKEEDPTWYDIYEEDLPDEVEQKQFYLLVGKSYGGNFLKRVIRNISEEKIPVLIDLHSNNIGFYGNCFKVLDFGL